MSSYKSTAISSLKDVREVLCIGVLHRGADLAYWATFAAIIVQFGQLSLGNKFQVRGSLGTKPAVICQHLRTIRGTGSSIPIES